MNALRQPQPRSRRAARAFGRAGRWSAGFTLVEVLVALAVVAITLGAGLKAAGTITDSAERLAGVTAAHWCADNALTDLRLTRQFPGGDSDFDCRQLGREFRGRLQSLPTPNPNFRRVEAIVRDDQDRVLATITTVIGRY